MKSKKILTLIFAVLLVFSLFGCGKKEPVEDTEPQDTTEQEELTPVVTEEEKQEPVELTQEELHELFKRMYDAERYAKANLPDDMYRDLFLKLPAKDIGTQVDANVYSLVEDEVARPKYDGKVLPADGFEQYVAWREAFLPDNTQTGETKAPEQEEIKGIPDENTEEPFDGNDDPSLIDKDSKNGDDTAVIRNGSGATDVPAVGLDRDEYVTPSYEIVG